MLTFQKPAAKIVSYPLFFNITHLAKLFKMQTFYLTQLGKKREYVLMKLTLSMI